MHTLRDLRLVFFDMDGVLLDCASSWRHIHSHFNTDNNLAVTAYLRGEIDDEEFIRRDVKLWHTGGIPVSKERIEAILANVPLMPGAQECVNALSQQNIQTAIVSAGLDFLAARIAAILGIEHVLANGIKTDSEGRLTGDGVVRVRLTKKDEAVRRLADKLNVPLSSCVAVGNSCFDIPMFEACSLGIAFNPEDICVKTAADVTIDSKNLQDILVPLQPYLRLGR
jgi:phosphoserine phosphatase